MIGKITEPRGERVEGLIYYLFGPGRREEHTDPHIIAGWRHPAELEPPLREDGKRDFRRLLGLLNQPHAAMGKWGFRRPVWHCSMRAASRDKMLSDDEWAQIACDVMDRPPADRRGPSPRRPADAALRRLRGSRCGVWSARRQPGWPATRSSSPACPRPEYRPASGSAPAIPARSPGTRSRCPATRQRMAGRCGTGAAGSAPT